MTKLAVKPVEGSSFLITVGFKDMDGTPFVPITCAWTLTDGLGTVLNNREKVSASVTAPLHRFILSGADLKFADGKTKGNRVFTIEGTFDSVYGEDLPYREQIGFSILDTVVD